MTKPLVRKGVVLATAVTLLVGALATGGAASPSSSPSKCRASVVRVDFPLLDPLLNPTFEPFVANKNLDPCTSEKAGVLPDPLVLPNGLGTLRALYATTTSDPGEAMSESGVAQLELSVGGHTIKADVLTAEASAECGPVLTSSSHVVGLEVDGQTIEVPPGNAHMDIPIAGLGTLHLNEEEVTPTKVTRRALFLDTNDPTVGVVDLSLPDIVVAEAIASFDAACESPLQPPPPSPAWMNGGGKVVAADSEPSASSKPSVSHGFILHCDELNAPNNLQVNWGRGKHFHMETVYFSRCNKSAGDPDTSDSGKPSSDIDYITGAGSGRCNGGDATVSWEMTDEGEPGDKDKATFHIRPAGIDDPETCTLDITGRLVGGNHQAHKGG